MVRWFSSAETITGSSASTRMPWILARSAAARGRSCDEGDLVPDHHLDRIKSRHAQKFRRRARPLCSLHKPEITPL